MMYPNPNGELTGPAPTPVPPTPPPTDAKTTRRKTWIGLGILVGIPLMAYLLGSARGA